MKTKNKPTLVTIPANALLYLIPLHNFASNFSKFNDNLQKKMNDFFEVNAPNLSLYDFIEYCPSSYTESDKDIEYIFSFISSISKIKSHQPSIFSDSNSVLKALIRNPDLFSGLNIELPRSSLEKITDIACRLTYFYNTRFHVCLNRDNVIPNLYNDEAGKSFISLLTKLNTKRCCGSMDRSLRDLIAVYRDEELADIHGYIKSQKDISRENATIKRKNDFIYNKKVDKG